MQMNAGKLTMRHFEVLRELGRQPTWTDAGDALGMAQSSVSQAVARMEVLLGTALFEAAGTRRVPTRAGEAYIALAGRVLDDLVDTHEGVSGGSLRGVLRVGVIDAVALYLLPARRFAEQHPRVEVQVTVDVSDALVERLGERRLDVAVVSGPQPTLEVDEVTSEALRIYGSFDPATPCVLYPDGSRTRTLIEAGLAGLGIRPRVTSTAPNPAVLHRLAQLGGLWTVLPESVVSEMSEPLVEGPVVAHRPIVAVRRHRHDPLAEAFVGALTHDYR